jgi:hypothetical protein
MAWPADIAFEKNNLCFVYVLSEDKRDDIVVVFYSRAHWEEKGSEKNNTHNRYI